LGHYLLLTGPHVLYDGHIFLLTQEQHPMLDWEIFLADVHYSGISQVLTPFKRDHELSYEEIIYNVIHSFYRSRVEQCIRRIKKHNMFTDRYRGSWDVLN